jgi:rRNA maturation protein Nop10
MSRTPRPILISMRNPRPSQPSPQSPNERFERTRRLEQAREQLAALRPGGSPATAMHVVSAAIIESRATTSMPCPHCGGQYRVLEHTRPVPQLRRVDVECRHCATPRTLWFTIVDREPN